MKTILNFFLFVALCIIFEGCKDNSTDPEIDNCIDTMSVAYKPNLYLYPQAKLNLFVDIQFPLGGELLQAIPNYENGWSVSVDTNGIIDNFYTYLFYEYRVPDYYQKEEGWIIEQDELQQFFETNMSKSGFNKKEIKDFTDYWIPKLVEFEYYEIYPQYKSILNKMSILTFSEVPDNFYRLQYLIKGRDNNEAKIEIPKIEIANRKGFYVMEWGVIF